MKKGLWGRSEKRKMLKEENGYKKDDFKQEPANERQREKEIINNKKD